MTPVDFYDKDRFGGSRPTEPDAVPPEDADSTEADDYYGGPGVAFPDPTEPAGEVDSDYYDTSQDFPEPFEPDVDDLKARLSAALALATPWKPDQAAHIRRAADDLGVPISIAEADPQLASRYATLKGIDYDRLMKDSPAFAEWMTDPRNAVSAMDDIKNLAGLEWIVRSVMAGYSEGSATDESSLLQFERLNGNKDPRLLDRIQYLEKQYPPRDYDYYDSEGWWEESLVEWARMMPMVYNVGIESIPYGLGAGMTGAAMGLAAGPAAPISSTALFVAGMTAGTSAAAYVKIYKREAGMAFGEMEKVVDENGNRLDPVVMRYAAHAYGAFSSGLEQVGGAGWVFASAPARRIAKRALMMRVIKAVKSPSVRRALLGLAKGATIGIGVEASTEGIQQAGQIIAAEITQELSTGDFKQISFEEAGKQVGSSFMAAAKASSIFMLPSVGTTFAYDMGRAATAKSNKEAMERLGNSAKAVKLRERLPDQHRDLVDMMVADAGGEIDTVYIDGEKFVELFQRAGVPLEDLERQIPSLRESLEEARKTKADIAIPLSEYVSELAGSEHHAGLVSHMRLRADQMTPTEAEAWEAERKERQEKATAELEEQVAEQGIEASEIAEVADDVQKQLVESGSYTTDVAAPQARLFALTIATHAREVGLTPMELYRKVGLEIVGPRGEKRRYDPTQAAEPISRAATKRSPEDVAQRREDLIERGFPLEATHGGEPVTIVGVVGKTGRRGEEPGEATIEGLNARSGQVVARSADGKTFIGFAESFELDGGDLEQRSAATVKKLAKTVPGLSRVLPYLTEVERLKLGPKSAARLVEIFEGLPEPSEMASVAFSGRAKRGWYRDSAIALVDIFGLVDAPRFAALLGATSPQTAVKDGAENSIRIWVAWNNAGRPQSAGAIRKIMAENVQGKKGDESILYAWVNNTIRALTAEDPTEILLSGPKVNSFMLNLRGFVNEVTNDAWMANYAGIDQGLFAGLQVNEETGDPGKGVGYMAFSAAIRNAAKILSQRTGETWTPAEIQETIWSWAKTLYETGAASEESRPLLEIVQSGDLKHDDIADTADIAVLFTQTAFRKLLEEGGYGDQLRKAERTVAGRGRVDGAVGLQGAAASPEGAGIARDAFEQHLGRAARRLDALLRERQSEAAATRRGKARRQALLGIRRELHGLPGDEGDGAQSAPYRQKGKGAPRERRGLGNGVLAVAHTVDDRVGAALDKVGLRHPDVLELSGERAADAFAEAVARGKELNSAGAAVELKSLDDYRGMRLFLSADKRSGFALDGDDVVSMFTTGQRNTKGTAMALLLLAIQQGGRRLDAFDTVLPDIYSQLGFRVTSRIPWDESKKPDGWDKEFFGEFNNGEPDVIFMVYDPDNQEEYGGRKEGQFFEEYADASASQKREAERVWAGGRGTWQTSPSADPVVSEGGARYVGPELDQDDSEPVLYVAESQELRPTAAAVGLLRVGLYDGPSTSTLKVGKLKTGITRIKSAKDVAHLAASLRKKAQEAVMIVITDVRGEVIGVLQHTGGVTGSSQIEVHTLLAPVFELVGDGAARLWMVHNHPSGSPKQSKEDGAVSRAIGTVLRGSGISYEGSVVVSPGGEGSVSPQGQDSTTFKIPAALRDSTVDVLERRIVKMPRRAVAIRERKDLIRVLEASGLQGKSGILLTAPGHRPIAFLEMSVDEMRNLRSEIVGEGVSKIVMAAAGANADSMFLQVPDLNDSADAVRNMVSFASPSGIKLVDVVDFAGRSQGESSQGMLSPEFDFQQRPLVPPAAFHSRLQAVLMDKLPGKGTGRSYLKTLESWAKSGAYKPDEFRWSGLPEWLESKAGEKISKYEVMDFLAAGGTRVRVTVKGAETTAFSWVESVHNEPQAYLASLERDRADAAIAENRAWSTLNGIRLAIENKLREKVPGGRQVAAVNAYIAIYGDDLRSMNDEKVGLSDLVKEHVSEEELRQLMAANADHTAALAATLLVSERVENAARARRRLWENAAATDAQYKAPELRVDGYHEDYREVVLSLPTEEFNEKSIPEFTWEMESQYGNDWNSRLTQAEKEEKQRVIEQSIRNDAAGKRQFAGGHFRDVDNVVVFFRCDVRTSADGRKMLFLEEIQSDWHQSGRKLGYGDAVPDAPFKPTQAWVTLAFKHALKLAVELGADQVAWTTGEQQTNRYDLRGVIDAVDWDPWTGVLSIMGVGFDDIIEQTVAKEDLHTYVGEDLANKLIANAQESIDYVNGWRIVKHPTKENAFAAVKVGDPDPAADNMNDYSFTSEADATEALRGETYSQVDGDGLEFGGEAMASFYDKIVVSAVNKYSKKIGGGRVGTTEVRTSLPLVLSRSNLQAVMDRAADEVNKIELGESESLPEEEKDKSYTILELARSALSGELSAYRDLAEILGGDLGFQTETETVHSIDIAPGMRESVLAGQELFQPGDDESKPYSPRAGISLGDERTVIRLTESSDLSSFMHESAHLFWALRTSLGTSEQASQQLRDDVTATREWMARHSGRVYAWIKKNASDKEALAEIERRGGAAYVANQAMDGAFGLSGEDPASRAVNEGLHEFFASAFEAYLFDGEAPSVELQHVFRSFRAWLMTVYENLRDLFSAPRHREIRDVMDRMIASKEQIQEARRESRLGPLFASADQGGMTDAEYAKLLEIDAEANAEAEESVLRQVLSDVRRRRTEEYEARKAELSDILRAELEAEPARLADKWLRTGVWGLDVDPPEGDPPKLDAGVLAELYDDETVAALPGGRHGVKRASGATIDPDTAARLFGLQGGDELVTALTEMQPLEEAVSEAADKQLQAEFPALTDPASIAEEAVAAVHNDKRDVVLSRELAILRSLRADPVAKGAERVVADDGARPAAEDAEALRVARKDLELAQESADEQAVAEAVIALRKTEERVRASVVGRRAQQAALKATRGIKPELAELRRVAQALIAGKRIGSRRELRSDEEMAAARAAGKRVSRWKRVGGINPGRYHAQATKAAQEAQEAVARRDYAEAERAKQRQILNHYAYRYARDAQARVEKDIRYLKRFETTAVRQRLGLAGHDYLDQIDALLARFDLRSSVTKKAVERRVAFLRWVKQQEEAGHEVVLDERLEKMIESAEKKHYSELTVGELAGLRDVVRNIAHLASMKLEFISSNKKRARAEVKIEVISSIERNVKLRKPRPTDPTKRDDKKEALSRLVAHVTKMESFFRKLDGYANLGPVWENFYKPIDDAASNKKELLAEYGRRTGEIMKRYSREERRQWHRKRIKIPEIGERLTKGTIMSIALNLGNDGNRQALMDGHGWSEGQIDAVLNYLDKRDMDTVQAIWNLVDSLWPMIAKLQKELTGITPAQVEARELVTQHGVYRGGYYPIAFDVKAGRRADERATAQDVREMFGGNYLRAQTRHGHTIARVGSGGQKLTLHMGVFSDHISAVIHDLTHRRAVLDVDSLIRDRDIADAIETHAGLPAYKELKEWITAVATEDRVPMSPFERLWGMARSGASISFMGYKATTAIAQTMGLFTSVDVLARSGAHGERYMLKALWDFANTGPVSMGAMRDEVLELSVTMRHRQATFDRDARDAMKSTSSDLLPPEIREYAFFFAGMMDLAVCVPTWRAAFAQAMDGHVVEIEMGDRESSITYADMLVRQSQSTGEVKDLAGVQRGSEYQKSIVMFYSYFSQLANLAMERSGQLKKGGLVELPRTIASLAYLWWLPAVVGELIVRRGPSDEEDWWDWFVRNESAYAFSPVPMGRDLVQSLTSGYDYDITPVQGVFESLVRLARQAGQGDADRQLAKSAVMAGGFWYRLPSRQAWITGEATYDLITGKEVAPIDFIFSGGRKK